MKRAPNTLLKDLIELLGGPSEEGRKAIAGQMFRAARGDVRRFSAPEGHVAKPVRVPGCQVPQYRKATKKQVREAIEAEVEGRKKIVAPATPVAPTVAAVTSISALPLAPPAAPLPKARKAEHQAKERAEREAREQAERQAREQAERQARDLAERQAREQAERQARELAERQARERAERQAREQADRGPSISFVHVGDRPMKVITIPPQMPAERQAREQAERQAREQAEHQAREQAERQAREQAERQAREQTDPKKAAEEKAREILGLAQTKLDSVKSKIRELEGDREEDLSDAQEERLRSLKYELNEAENDVEDSEERLKKIQNVRPLVLLPSEEKIDDVIGKLLPKEGDSEEKAAEKMVGTFKALSNFADEAKKEVEKGIELEVTIPKPGIVSLYERETKKLRDKVFSSKRMLRLAVEAAGSKDPPPPGQGEEWRANLLKTDEEKTNEKWREVYGQKKKESGKKYMSDLAYEEVLESFRSTYPGSVPTFSEDRGVEMVEGTYLSKTARPEYLVLDDVIMRRGNVIAVAKIAEKEGGLAGNQIVLFHAPSSLKLGIRTISRDLAYSALEALPMEIIKEKGVTSNAISADRRKLAQLVGTVSFASDQATEKMAEAEEAFGTAENVIEETRREEQEIKASSREYMAERMKEEKALEKAKAEREAREKAGRERAAKEAEERLAREKVAREKKEAAERAAEERRSDVANDFLGNALRAAGLKDDYKREPLTKGEFITLSKIAAEGAYPMELIVADGRWAYASDGFQSAMIATSDEGVWEKGKKKGEFVKRERPLTGEDKYVIQAVRSSLEYLERLLPVFMAFDGKSLAETAKNAPRKGPSPENPDTRSTKTYRPEVTFETYDDLTTVRPFYVGGGISKVPSTLPEGEYFFSPGRLETALRLVRGKVAVALEKEPQAKTATILLAREDGQLHLIAGLRER